MRYRRLEASNVTSDFGWRDGGGSPFMQLSVVKEMS